MSTCQFLTVHNNDVMTLELLTLAALVESIVEAITAPFKITPAYRPLLLRGVAIIVGLLLAFGFQIDYSGELLTQLPIQPWVGYVFTGFIVGVGSSLIHDILERYGRKVTSITATSATTNTANT